MSEPVNDGTVHKREYDALQELLRTQDEDDGGPIRPAAMDIHPSIIIETEDGRKFHEISLTFKRSDVERMRQGYACVECWEKFDSGWPDRCPACGFRVKEFQSDRFAKMFEGTQWVGSRIDLGEEQERVRSWAQQDGHNPKSSIFLPHGVSE